MDKQTAASISKRLLELSEAAQRSLVVVKANDSIETATAYRALVGRLMGYAYTNVLAQLWREYPDLEPEGMTAPDTPVGFSSLAPESRAALEGLVVQGRSDFARLRDLPPSEALPEEAVAELEGVLEAIESFIANPDPAGRPLGPRRIGV